MDKDRRLSGMEAALYLRKSRAEEGMETDEVLAKHREALLSYAQKAGLHIVETYPEVVSGESLHARPEILRLLDDVEQDLYDCILCMDLDRLSRGRMRDQGLILDTFKEHSTLIVTPDKIYDLADEMDEEYAELKTFMARREYKIINKRLQRGLQQSIRDGCYCANAPYGYHKATVDRKPTLEIYEPEARFVRMMFELYAKGYGCVTIAHHVNALGAKPHRAEQFCRNSIFRIITSPTYAGKIVWNQKQHIKKGSRGNDKNIVIYQPREKWTVVPGLHPAIIDQDLFDLCQKIAKRKYTPPHNDGTVRNPLQGLVCCANCGAHMQMAGREPQPYLMCNRRGCCAATQIPFVEQRILDYLRDTLTAIRVSGQVQSQTADRAVLQTMLEQAQKAAAAAQRQKARLYELLELGEYDIPTFRERMAAVKAKLERSEHAAAEAQRGLSDLTQADPQSLARKIEELLLKYPTASPAQKNTFLRSIIRDITYHKPKKTHPSDFTLDIHLLPY